jgi:hypothetical protein
LLFPAGWCEGSELLVFEYARIDGEDVIEIVGGLDFEALPADEDGVDDGPAD